MTELMAAFSLLRDADPTLEGFQPHFLYVVMCLVCPAVLGVLSTALIALIQRITTRKQKGSRDSA